MTRMPGMRGADHIGFTVPDLDAAVKFLVDVLGCIEIYELNPPRAEGNWMRDNMNVHPEAWVRKVKLLRCGAGANFEVFEYQSPDQKSAPPQNSDIGGHHVALYVDDIDVAVEHLKQHGVQVSAGTRWTYFLAPWGMQFELVSFPQGKAYEATASTRLWDTRKPAD
jgi:catechol 2,3-dioxygenase-like lactoylglutathione lyase family enzyme